jgi:hypothetical protein
MKKKLFVIRTVSGQSWLVRASGAKAALEEWPDDAEEAHSASAATRSEAAWLREIGQADSDA